MKTRVHAPSATSLRRLAAALRRGELVAMPTETVYGLAANALDARACRRIFTAKRRPANDPLIVHILNVTAARRLADFSAPARALARAFWPGPLTLVLTKKPVVPDIVTSRQSTVALRSPAHPLARQLIALAGVPLAAPSANPFGYVSPTTAAHVLDGLEGRIPHVLDGGECGVGLESTIVDVSQPGRAIILRPGAISAGDLRRALAKQGLRLRISTARRHAVLAPGMLPHHYSPRTPLTLGRAPRSARAPQSNTGVIHWRKPARPQPTDAWLSPHGDVSEAAHSLYAVLRRMDVAGFDRLYCERAPVGAGPLGEAINDRLTRAAAKTRR